MLTLKKNLTPIRGIVLLIIFLQLCQHFALGQPPKRPSGKNSSPPSQRPNINNDYRNFRNFFDTARLFKCEDTLIESVVRYKALATQNLGALTAQDKQTLCNSCRFAIVNLTVNKQWCDAAFNDLEHNDPKAAATCYIPLKGQCKTCKDTYCQVVFSKKLPELKGNLFLD